MGAMLRKEAATVAAALACTAAVTAFVPAVQPGRPAAPPGAVELGLDTMSAVGQVCPRGARPEQGLLLAAGALGTAYVSARRGASHPTRARAKATARQAFSGELGATLPMKYFDPLGCTADDDVAAFRRRRMAEIKHGRVAMLACIGHIVPEYFRWPGYCPPSMGIKFADLPNGVAALQKLPAEGWAQLGVFIALLEFFPLTQEQNCTPGDVPGCGKLGVPWFLVAGRPGTVCSGASNERSLNAEINDGRLAMLAITGMVAQNCLLGTTGPEAWIPSSAFESELGSTPPLKYRDPLGLAADGGAVTFGRGRSVEVKNGRVATLACIGNITPEYFHWPGYCSPSEGITFADQPSGIQALYKVL